jgi:nucleotide-binding universal stress UspA family protein
MRKILVGFDDSDEARDALTFGGRLARLEDAELIVAVAGLFDAQISTREEEKMAASGRRAVFAAVTEQLGADRRYSPAIIEGLPAARGLTAKAEEDGADLIVVGSTRRGRIGQVFPGSVGAQLLHGSPCPVAIVPRGFRDAPPEVRGRGGIAYDGSREADLALDEGIRLARRFQVGLRLIAVDPEGGGPGSALDAALERVPDDVDAERELLRGEPETALLEAAGDLDFLVMGSRGRGPLARTLLGSVSVHVCCGAACPVIVAPRPAAHGIEEARAATAPPDSGARRIRGGY